MTFRRPKSHCAVGNVSCLQKCPVSLSSTIIKYTIFNSFLFSKSSLNRKLLNTYLIEVHERDTKKR